MYKVPQTILIVDDEPSVRKVLRRCFETESYQVVEADCGQAMRDALNEQSIDLITLDIRLADEDGLQLARDIRSHSSVPIIMVSGKNELIDKVVGLEIGADDYVSKPFELREVLARVRSVLRRASARNDTDSESESVPGSTDAVPDTLSASTSSSDRGVTVFRFDDLSLCPCTREVIHHDGRRCELTTAEFDLLRVFVDHSQQVLTRDQIMNRMKGRDWHPTDRTVDNHVAHLRRKLAEHGSPESIKTLRGIGYQFILPVSTQMG